MFQIYFRVIVILISMEFVFPLPLINSVEDCYFSSPEETRIFLTISSLYVSVTETGIVKRQLEVNWVNVKPEKGDKIDIYRKDPVQDPKEKPVCSIEPSKHPSGFFRTDVELPVHVFNLKPRRKDTCLGYWAVYRDKNGEFQTHTCIRIQPFWMDDISYHLSSQRLQDIMIPGTHDSGSFYFRKEREPLSKYKYAQEQSIFNQLVHGLRYFDLRIGYYKNSKDKFYINHNFLKTEHSVISVLREVQKFMALSTKEVVILDFHNFPHGFNDESIHMKLQSLIISSLGPYLIPSRPEYVNATFSDFWEKKKRILVSYDSGTRESFFRERFWPSIPRAWGNKQKPEDLRDYFEEVFQKPIPEGLWASMAEITPNTRSIILHPESGLRYFADQINRNVTHWFRDLYWQKANIVATDYFLGNDIIDVAIRTNRIKGVCPEELWSSLTPYGRKTVLRNENIM